MRIDNWFQLIIPLTFFAIWALTAIFNRDAQPLPPRQGRPQGPNGPRTAGGMAPARPLEPRPEGPLRDPALRWSSPAGRPQPGPGGLTRGGPFAGREEEILIIRPEPSRPARSAGTRSPGGSSSTRRASRPRSSPAPLPPQDEGTRPRALGAPLAQKLPLPVGRPLELSSLTHPLSPLVPEGATGPATASPPATSAARPSAQPSTLSIDFGLLTGSPARLREAFILSELLQPPLALRRPPAIRR